MADITVNTPTKTEKPYTARRNVYQKGGRLLVGFRPRKEVYDTIQRIAVEQDRSYNYIIERLVEWALRENYEAALTDISKITKV